MSKKIRYEIEVEGAKIYLAPLSFPVAEAALGFIFATTPRYLTAGGIIINSLLVKGSKELQDGGKHYDTACLNAYAAVNGLTYTYSAGKIEVPGKRLVKGKDGQPDFYQDKVFSCEIKETVPREVLEDALGLIMPNMGNPRPLTAGKLLLDSNWLSGDDEIKQDPELLIVACLACFFILKHKQSSIKKV